MLKIKITHRTKSISLMAIPTAALATALAIFALSASAKNPPNPDDAKSAKADASLVGDPDRGADQFEATCAECHGAAATAPTLRGIVNRPVASIATFYGYSEALKAKQPMTWTVENLNAYLKSPPKFAPGNLMDREYPDAQMRADIIAFLATLPPPK